jgi:hypothetical protein
LNAAVAALGQAERLLGIAKTNQAAPPDGRIR